MSETEMMKPYVWLKTCDDSIQLVDREIAMVCPFICQEISEKGTGSSKSSAICLPEKVSLAMLTLILDYCRFHHAQGHSNKERKLYDEEFVRIVADNLYELAYAAYNLELKPLIDLTCHEIARKVEINSPKEMCDIFHWLDDRAKEEMLKLIINTTCNPSRLLKRLMKNKRKEFERIQKNVEVEREEKHVVDERPIEELVAFINGSNDGEAKGNTTCKNKKKNRRRNKKQQKNSSLKEVDDHVVVFDDEIHMGLMGKNDKEVKEENDHVVEFDDEIDQGLMEKFDKELEKEDDHVVVFDDVIDHVLMEKIDNKMEEEDDRVVEFDDEIDQALTANIDREVEEEDDHVVEFDDDGIHQAKMIKINKDVEEFDRRLSCSWEERIKEIITDACNHKEIVA